MDQSAASSTLEGENIGEIDSGSVEDNSKIDVSNIKPDTMIHETIEDDITDKSEVLMKEEISTNNLFTPMENSTRTSDSNGEKAVPTETLDENVMSECNSINYLSQNDPEQIGQVVNRGIIEAPEGNQESIKATVDLSNSHMNDASEDKTQETVKPSLDCSNSNMTDITEGSKQESVKSTEDTCIKDLNYRKVSSDSSDSSSESSDNDESNEHDSEEEGANRKKGRGKQFENDMEKKGGKVSEVIPRTKGEILPQDLPPIEELQITVADDVEMKEVGIVNGVVGVLVIIQAQKELPALNIDTILFLEGRKVFGQVFETFGPVSSPLYSVRFNSPEHITERGIEVGMMVYWAPEAPEYTHYVFLEQLRRMKGSDASWEHNNEPPSRFVDYSDDEMERKAKSKQRTKNTDDDKNEDDNKRRRRQRRNGGGPMDETSSQQNFNKGYNNRNNQSSTGRGGIGQTNNGITSWPPSYGRGGPGQTQWRPVNRQFGRQNATSGPRHPRGVQQNHNQGTPNYPAYMGAQHLIRNNMTPFNPWTGAPNIYDPQIQTGAPIQHFQVGAPIGQTQSAFVNAAPSYLSAQPGLAQYQARLPAAVQYEGVHGQFGHFPQQVQNFSPVASNQGSPPPQMAPPGTQLYSVTPPPAIDSRFIQNTDSNTEGQAVSVPITQAGIHPSMAQVVQFQGFPSAHFGTIPAYATVKPPQNWK